MANVTYIPPKSLVPFLTSEKFGALSDAVYLVVFRSTLNGMTAKVAHWAAYLLTLAVSVWITTLL